MRNHREYNKEKITELLANFPAAYHKYICDEIDRANNSNTDNEFDRIVEERMSEKQYFIEYLLDNGVQFEYIGHWVCGYDDQDSWTCSECGFPVKAVDDLCDPYEAEIEYCEKCGAKMVKPKKNTEKGKNHIAHICELYDQPITETEETEAENTTEKLQYCVAHGDGRTYSVALKSLEKAVNEKISEGWSLYGNPIITPGSNYFFASQPMTKNN